MAAKVWQRLPQNVKLNFLKVINGNAAYRVADRFDAK